jgi:hypothetical protein
MVGRRRRIRLARGCDWRVAVTRRWGAALRLRHRLESGRFYPQFDAVVLLSAPVDVLLRRIETRTTNLHGKAPEERALILRHAAEVEPLLRDSCTHEIDAASPDRRCRCTTRRNRVGPAGLRVVNDRRVLAPSVSSISATADGSRWMRRPPTVGRDGRASGADFSQTEMCFGLSASSDFRRPRILEDLRAGARR